MPGCAAAFIRACTATTVLTCATGHGRTRPALPPARRRPHVVRVLVVNAGSSSLKLAVIGDEDQTLAACELDDPRTKIDLAALRAALKRGLGDADVVGHRIVHGGERFAAPVRIDDEVETALRELVDLAPLHQPKSLAAL